MKKILFIFALALPTLYFSQQAEKNSKCDLPANFQEPQPDKKIQRFLKIGDATIEDLRKHIAVENEVELSDIKFLRISEQKGNGMYQVCVKGQEMKYKRMGTVFMKNNENPFDTLNQKK